MTTDLKNLALKSKARDKYSLMKIIEKFNPLLIKYSNKLDYDGAYSDLEIAFIETIYSLPIEKYPYMKEEQITAYINKSIISKHIKLSKKNRLISNIETELNLEIAEVDYMKNIEDRSFVYHLLEKLTKSQKKILVLKFIYGYKEVEIADKLHITKQSVNGTKKRALKILRNYLCM